MSAPIPEDLQQEIAMLAGKILLEDRDTAIMSRVLTKLRDYAALESQVQTLRAALEEIRSIASGENDFYEDDAAGIVAVDKIARAVLDATEPKEKK